MFSKAHQTMIQPVLSSKTSSISSFLLPFLYNHQSRSASILSSLSDRPGAYNKKIRRGRGPSSGKGKTSGRGHKGQKQHGKVPFGFQGGQTPDHVVHGKEGFINFNSVEMSPVNLSRIQEWITAGRLDPSKPITLKELTSTRAIHGIKDGVKLLARGANELATPVNIVVSRASQSAIAAVEALGGTVTTRYYTPIAIRRIRAGQMDPYISLRWDQDAMKIDALRREHASLKEERVMGMGYEYRLPDPTSRKDLEYYRDPKHRGYLSHTIKEGEGPSLYFKPPLEGEELRLAKLKGGKRRRGSQSKEDSRLW